MREKRELSSNEIDMVRSSHFSRTFKLIALQINFQQFRASFGLSADLRTLLTKRNEKENCNSREILMKSPLTRLW